MILSYGWNIEQEFLESKQPRIIDFQFWGEPTARNHDQMGYWSAIHCCFERRSSFLLLSVQTWIVRQIEELTQGGRLLALIFHVQLNKRWFWGSQIPCFHCRCWRCHCWLSEQLRDDWRRGSHHIDNLRSSFHLP